MHFGDTGIDHWTAPMSRNPAQKTATAAVDFYYAGAHPSSLCLLLIKTLSKMTASLGLQSKGLEAL
ncbi:hypothetical protein [Salinisphaera orenii]|uniref:hypothetical protein n=1 Tax=Salinisphaera orenii TaxID=856731 RepID=UPI000F4CE6F1|nr:hypothetical protein [Salinisphaera orenii]